MSKQVIELSDQEVVRIESILMDSDEKEALLFLKEVLRPKLRAKGSTALDSAKGTGIIT